MSAPLAVAAARRSWIPTVIVDTLPTVPRSQGTRSVSPKISRTESRGRSNSSAIARENPLRMPCPYSTLPEKAIAPPCRFIISNAASGPGVSRSSSSPAHWGGPVTTSAASSCSSLMVVITLLLAGRAAPRLPWPPAEYARTCHSGRCCRSEPLGSADRRAAGCAIAKIPYS